MPNEIFLPQQNDNESLKPDVVDDEDVDWEERGATPWDPTKIRITTNHFSLREVAEQIEDKEIDLSPDFQRDYVWKQRQRTRLIESILLGIPLPAFYFNQDKDGTYQVVDGVQRLSTISLFMRDKHVLDRADLEYLRDMHGLTYSKLDPAAARRLRSTQIVVHVIEPQTPDEVKYDLFSRVNTLGSPLSQQEIRHAMSKPRSRDFLKELSELPMFDKATDGIFWRKDSEIRGGWVRDSGRMMNRELVLRFCAFRHYSEDDYRKYATLNAFLVEYTRRLDNCSGIESPISDVQLHELKKDFEAAMINAEKILGRSAFRRGSIGDKRRGPINRAIFESQAIALAGYSVTDLLSKKYEIEVAFRKLFADPAYARSVTVGTGDPKAVNTRLQRTKAAIVEVLS